jgi:hypothetical protein
MPSAASRDHKSPGYEVESFSFQCVVIGLQSTGEARTLEQLGETGALNEFVSTAKYVFVLLMQIHRQITASTLSCNLPCLAFSLQRRISSSHRETFPCAKLPRTI